MVKRVVVIANPLPIFGGGPKRALSTLRHYPELGVDVYLYVPYCKLLELQAVTEKLGSDAIKNAINVFESLEKRGIYVSSLVYSMLEDTRFYNPLSKIFGTTGYKNLVYSTLYTSELRKQEIIHAKKFLKQNNELSRVDVIYSMHGTWDAVTASSYIAKSLGKPLVVLLQATPYSSLKELIIESFQDPTLSRWRRISVTLVRSIRRIGTYASDAKKAYEYAIRLGVLRGIFSVSEAPFLISGLDKRANKLGIVTKILKPSIAIDKELKKYSLKAREKDNFAIFYARLTSSKGILEIPYIAKILEKNGYELIIFGRFERESIKRKFLELVKKLNVRMIKYNGFVQGEQLWRTIARAKVVVYPSHKDAFPLAVLEALGLRTSVVAYDIPAIRSIYTNIKPVKIVKEWNFVEMARSAINILKMKDRDYDTEHDNPYTRYFLDLHSSWRNVAKTEIHSLDNVIKYGSINSF